ncbi:MAG: glycosyltransferase family 4 protein [Paludibacter sp.]|nr:glycosyltransferase family 4 protein [Paludibacter sp.]
MELTKNDILSIYKKIKHMANEAMGTGNVSAALEQVSVAANYAYLYNFIYRDDELENLIAEISVNLTGGIQKITGIAHRYVMIDAFGNPNKGLTQQYLRGLISMQVDFLYISENVSPAKQPVYDEVLASSKGNLCLVPEGNHQEKIAYICEQIVAFNPIAIIAHLSPWDVVGTTVLYAFPGITRYNLNLTDHAFWLGAGCFDYNFEFRNFGASISVEKRGFNKEQILLNPFYPVVEDSVPFAGFPSETNGKVILFSGGDYQKIYGDNKRFLNMMEEVLTRNSNAVLLFAGKGQNRAPIENFIRDRKLGSRFILLGERKDINQVFMRCDIYLGTYPVGGGLMTQMAVYHSKPVVALVDGNATSNKLEEVIFNSQTHDVTISYDNIDAYYDEIEKLISNKKYREDKGKLLKNKLRSADVFNADLYSFLNGEKFVDFQLSAVNYEKRFEHYLKLNNLTTTDLGVLLFKNYKLKAFLYFPKASAKYFIKTVLFHLTNKFS